MKGVIALRSLTTAYQHYRYVPVSYTHLDVYKRQVEALNGEVISISATSNTHLNALDMDSAYGNDKNPLIEKSEFILSLFEQLVGAGNLSAKEKSILDRCTADVYREYIRSGYQSEVPTLKDLYRQLMLQPEEEARGLALSSDCLLYTSRCV